MPFVIFVAPVFTENAIRFIAATAGLPGVRLGVISQEGQNLLPDHVRARLAGHWRVDDVFNREQLVWASRSLAGQHGPIHRLFGAFEQLQAALAAAREELRVEGMSVAAALNFRDKSRMKSLLRQAGLPCARSRLVEQEEDAWRFAAEIGFPIVVKPPAGAAAQATFRANAPDEMRQALAALNPGSGRQVLLEEFVHGDEHSFETFSLEGRPLFHSLTHYFPSPLEVLRHPWMQWCLLLPREVDGPQYDDIRDVACRALAALGMGTGISHLEWFRRADGSLAISEVAARPPGAQIMTLISRANDIDAYQAWARLMVKGEFVVPERRYAVGAAYLRGMGSGRVKLVRGVDQAQSEMGHLIVDIRLPHAGQPAGVTYEGEGFIIVRHPETEVVREALQRLVSMVRVELH